MESAPLKVTGDIHATKFKVTFKFLFDLSCRKLDGLYIPL